MAAEMLQKFYRRYVITLLTIGVILLAILVGGLWYGSLRAEHAATAAAQKVNGLNNQIEDINNNLQQVKNINKGIQTLNSNVEQLNKELGGSASATSF